ncbi:MAG: Trk system potassium transporter TrkA, partial [Desulfovibrionaceae bacterium]|nr:Trk system potassium transporter TrkA [Desulfovibrionaceae bacterium]
ILACMVAKSLGVGETVARVHQNEYLQLVETLGIDHAVCPRVAAVNGLLHYIRRGKVVASVTVGQDAAEAMEVMISEDSALAGRPVSELNLPRGVLLLTVIRENDVFLPKGASVLEPGDRVLFMTAKERIPEIEAILTAQRKESK